MSEEQLKAFIEKVKADTSLQEKLKAAADVDAALAIAKDAGFSVSVDDWQVKELSDEELEGAAGGADVFSYAGCGSKPSTNKGCGGICGLSKLHTPGC